MSYTPPPPPPPEGGGPGYGGGYGYAPAPKNNPKALAALIVGIVSVVLAFCCSIFGLVGIAAIVLGNSARREIAASGGQQTGDGMAKAGFILGIVGAAVGVVLFIVSLALAHTGLLPIRAGGV